MLCAKFGANQRSRLGGGIGLGGLGGLQHFANPNGRWKWAWPISRDSENRLEHFLAGVTYIPRMVSFGECSGSEK